jgi:hypothetical protein
MNARNAAKKNYDALRGVLRATEGFHVLMTDSKKDYAADTSVAALSRRYHLSEKSIRRILQKS